MKKSTLIASALLSSSLLTGCAVVDDLTRSWSYETGIDVSSEQMESLKDGKSDKSDVTRIVGYPSKKEIIRNTEIWYYNYTFIPPFPGQKNINRATVFEFNDKDILISHYKTASKSQDPLSQAAGLSD
ncbi:hypothetical protein [Marinomonas algarum]|uniref:Outer membrane protein assembly factor BamE n=1 Tax=Marinomonas algarum TaxID=2883105 RepID=A0A9X1LF69_9GAMM|nr:hypothetical protein [Marinomonas algarum]MCB5162598.1 hypothetical protein [Marinomonas algarum]